MNDALLLPEPLRPFLVLSEIDHTRLVVDDLFRRKFGDPPPGHPHHLAAFHRRQDGSLRLLSYSHMHPFGDIFLSGGACTDGDAVRAMPEAKREALSAAGGARHWVLAYALRRFADRCDAFFAYSGHPRARQICESLGFVDTGQPYLLARWHKPLHENVRRSLLAKARALGPF